MEEFSTGPETRIIGIHQQQEVALVHQLVDCVGNWSGTAQRALLIHDFFDQAPLGDHHGGPGSDLQRIYVSVLFRPFRELDVGFFEGNLVNIPNDWQCWRA